MKYCMLMLLLLTHELLAQGLFWENSPPEELVDTLMAAMSDEEIIAQLLLVGWQGTEPSQEITAWLQKRNIGGIKIFGWNGHSVPALAQTIGNMQEMAFSTPHGIPLFTATDQEGGWVRHVKDTTSITPGNLAIGASQLAQDAYLSGYYIGLELHAIGINMNFAPTVDIYVHPEADVIGPRAFSSDPQMASLMGVAYFRGMEAAKIIAAAKHFPGHGNTSSDSHGTLPVISDNFQTLWNRDLLPYRTLIKEGIPSLLIGHLSYPQITGDKRPSSLSSFFQKEILRSRIQFKGMVITDDLYMGGVVQYATTQQWSFPQLVLEAIMAGSDLILLSKTPNTQGSIWNHLMEHYQNSSKVRQRIQEACRIILLTKLRYLKADNAVPLRPDIEKLSSLVPNAQGNDFFYQLAHRSVSIIRDKMIPYQEENERILLAGNYPYFFQEGKKRFSEAGVYRFQNQNFYAYDQQDIQALQRLIPRYDRVIFCLSDPNTAGVLASLSAYSEKIIVLSILTPVYLLKLPWVHSAVATYGWGKDNVAGGLSVLLGDYAPEGTLPLNFDFSVMEKKNN